MGLDDLGSRLLKDGMISLKTYETVKKAMDRSEDKRSYDERWIERRRGAIGDLAEALRDQADGNPFACRNIKRRIK